MINRVPHSPILLPMLIALCLIVSGCKNKGAAGKTLFELLDSTTTGIGFVNEIKSTSEFNIYTYRNFYNGGGVAIGDINNDGLPDIFFTANQGPNKLYLNKGNFKFQDVTTTAGIGKKSRWSTGVAMADVNGDGWLDIYVCYSGDLRGDKRENELYINRHNGTFSEMAKAYGVEGKGYSTHAAFFDYDHDGDLDLFLLTNSFRMINSFNLQENERHHRDSIGGQRLMRNDGDHFTDVSESAGIYGSKIGFGLGVAVADLNNDGWQDIYVCNDFFERDYLYLNQRNGSFRESLEDEMHSISYSAMGADCADINNDGQLDLFVSEMLPKDEGRLKTNTTFETWDKYRLNLQYDYYHQFSRNTLQLNNGNGTFSEIGRLAGVEASDWSWGGLIADFDDDGNKDIFVSNGIFQDLTNRDYLQYISDEKVMHRILASKDAARILVESMTSTPIPNVAFKNSGDLRFVDSSASWGLDQPGFSNGAAYADLDNDGDLDLVVNNVNMPAFVYRNHRTELMPQHHQLTLALKGDSKNPFALGARVVAWCGGQQYCAEQMPVRGFQSTVDPRLHIGLGDHDRVDSLLVYWEGNKLAKKLALHADTLLTIDLTQAISGTNTSTSLAERTVFRPEILPKGLDFVHHESQFSDFDRQQLNFHMLSTQGPALAVADVNGDGLDDVYAGGAKDQPSALYLQTASGQFTRIDEPTFDMDRGSEDVDAIFFDADGDKDEDLFVVSGSSEFSVNSPALANRLYINNGKGHFDKSPQLLGSFGASYHIGACAKAADIDGDHDLDLFIGVRSIPQQYGVPCSSFIYINNGKGVFTDATPRICPELNNIGMVTDAQWLDFDQDGDADLLVAGEYMPLTLFQNNHGKLQNITRSAGFEYSNGWWNRLVITDLNGDGYPDIVAGNHGLNSRFRASKDKPIDLYTSDFDGNGSVESIVTCYNGDSSYPMLLRHDLVSVLPVLKKKYLRYEQYQRQTIQDIFSPEQLAAATKLSAYELSTACFINNKKGKFLLQRLPAQAQFSPMFGLASDDFDDDGIPDILCGGNFYESKPDVGIYDASYGALLKGSRNGDFRYVAAPSSGFSSANCIHRMVPMRIRGKKLILVANNNASLQLWSYAHP